MSKSDLKTKYIAFDAQVSIVDELFSSAFIIGRIIVERNGNRWATDKQTETMLRATLRGQYFSVDIFKMGYTDNKFVPQHRIVKWWESLSVLRYVVICWYPSFNECLKSSRKNLLIKCNSVFIDWKFYQSCLIKLGITKNKLVYKGWWEQVGPTGA